MITVDGVESILLTHAIPHERVGTWRQLGILHLMVAGWDNGWREHLLANLRLRQPRPARVSPVPLRCDAVSPDGRRCFRPTGHGGKHRIAPRPPTVETYFAVAEAWGVRGDTLEGAARFAMHRGVGIDDLVRGLAELRIENPDVFEPEG